MPARRSAAWSRIWRIGYRLVRIVDPLVRLAVAHDLPGLGRIVELRFVGRRTGRPRRVLVTLLTHDGRWYVGHPDGQAGWTLDIEASGWVDVESHGLSAARFAARRLPPGSERDAVIRSTAVQQPFPANVLYRAARRHIAAVGVYHRLEPLAVPAGGPPPTTIGPDPGPDPDTSPPASRPASAHGTHPRATSATFRRTAAPTEGAR